MTKHKIRKSAIIFIGAMIPFAALADAGTPMIWFGAFHLIFVNAIIGYVESRILLKRGIPNKAWLVIIANYVSMFVGLFLIAPYFTKDLYHINFWSGETFQYHASYQFDRVMTFLIGIAISFPATLVIEYPFFFYSVKEKTKREQLFTPFLIANAITYAAMTTIYFLFIF